MNISGATMLRKSLLSDNLALGNKTKTKLLYCCTDIHIQYIKINKCAQHCCDKIDSILCKMPEIHFSKVSR